MSQQFSHFDEQGHAVMVDISDKDITKREATAYSSIEVNDAVFEQIQRGDNKKGDVFGVARIAGIQATKQTSNLIPLCHAIPISKVSVQFDWADQQSSPYQINITCTVKTTGQTGVEMEALTGASVAALTIYDMCKAVDKTMTIGPTYLTSKSGGQSGDYVRD
ncbi:cyclic pyranopterin monophosphate synthase MoaC [Alkalibacillus salilacus]|uniref:Cyclic pyranopterin monophosphate synthase n=1 Tax=Alkalibacillus salilacus TaxID=284582 RepID=A0ABT9VBG3_9BACI|nr:cyclic pyranopterin monophosphate synthase MoaC [Alkalibacillus salilacus]MDQ0158281.1 cyclic pyranopterin phosphate synthase [Alkalibacillus salilacus]